MFTSRGISAFISPFSLRLVIISKLNNISQFPNDGFIIHDKDEYHVVEIIFVIDYFDSLYELGTFNTIKFANHI